ncbi:MAG: hypothetical protein IKW87_00260, partial [Ruminococcus sp.]|nr:hypothetical protein [Ruminococcus sp.]
LPIIVYLLGAKVMVNIGFCPLLSVNTMLNDFSIIHFSALSIAVLIIIVRTVSSKIKIGLT